jgi:predicted DNA-binding transcriptional regulator AlpA
MINKNLLPQTGFIRLPEVLSLIPVGKTSWWNGVKAGKYPKSVKLGPKTTAWRVEDIRQLIEDYSAKDSQVIQQNITRN